MARANSASDARHTEGDIRRKLIEDRVVDVMIAVGPHFFYTVTLPVTLWFLDKAKRSTERGDKVLFVDARQVFRQIDRAHRDWTGEQVEYLANIVRLYRGQPVETEGGSADLMAAKFPDGSYVDVPGPCKVATIDQIESQGWSLNPGRYVGTEVEELDEEEFEEKLAAAHLELRQLSERAQVLDEAVDKVLTQLLQK